MFISGAKMFKIRFVSLSLFSLVLILLLSACVRQTPIVPIPSAETQANDPFYGPIPTSSILQPDPVVEETLRIYPLRVGSTWVYEYLGYDATQEVIWRVTETIVDVKMVEGYYAAKMERTADLLEGDPPTDFLFTPETGVFWFLIDGEKIYRFETDYHTNLSDAWLVLIVPFPEPGDGWYPDPGKRASLEPGKDGFRYASEPYKENMSMNQTLTCYNIVTEESGAKDEGTFCETVGYFYFEQVDFDQPIGYRIELTGFSLQ